MASAQNQWVGQNTAILVIHGIGSQQAFETLDRYTRPLVAALRKKTGLTLSLSHQVARKPRSSQDGFWYDNFIRIEAENSSYCIDVYEYYWANLTEEAVGLSDIQRWAKHIAKGAKRFYKQNETLGTTHQDNSFFFRNGKFLKYRYQLVIWLLTRLIPWMRYAVCFLLYLLSWLPIPWLRGLLKTWLEKIQAQMGRSFANLIGDIVVYNTLDTKSKHYEIRKKILDGAKEALRYLIEPKPNSAANTSEKQYQRLLVAGHSLGSQIAFDAINRLTHLITQGEIAGFDCRGNVLDQNQQASSVSPEQQPPPRRVQEILFGLHTFGSPLDKIAFFLREQVRDSERFRLQLLKNFHCFKQKDMWPGVKIDEKDRLKSPFESLFDKILWHNYYDPWDFVSGSLDYYRNVHNINVQEIGRSPQYELKKIWPLYAHADYWENPHMFDGLVEHFLYA